MDEYIKTGCEPRSLKALTVGVKEKKLAGLLHHPVGEIAEQQTFLWHVCRK